METTIECFHWDGKRPEERDRLKIIYVEGLRVRGQWI